MSVQTLHVTKLKAKLFRGFSDRGGNMLVQTQMVK